MDYNNNNLTPNDDTNTPSFQPDTDGQEVKHTARQPEAQPFIEETPRAEQAAPSAPQQTPQSTASYSNESYHQNGNLYGKTSEDGSYSYKSTAQSGSHQYGETQTPQSSYNAYNTTPTYGTPSYTPPQTGYGTGSASSQPSQSAAPSYTWTAPQYSPGPKKREKKQGGWAGRIVALLLCCVISSAATLGIFTQLVKNGNIALQSQSSGGVDIVLNKVVDDDKTASSMTEINGMLTQQEVAKKLIPSVVCIQTYGTSNSMSYFGFEQQEEESMITPLSQGSGIIYSADGYIVTNAHVIEGASKIKIIVSDGSSYEAELVGSDTMTDLAVIKVTEDVELTPAEFGTSENLTVADEVMAIGNPGGIQFNSSVTMGYVSALNREVTSSDTGYTMNCIQTDAAINPGNSGGALVDMYGLVVGINSSKIVATGYEGLGFAIPMDTAAPIIQNLMEYGYVKDRAMLGISVQYIDSLTARFYGLSEGMYVAKVTTQEAMQSGVEVGDVITAIDGTPVTSMNTITTYLANKKPGETVTLTVSRSTQQGQNLQLELVLSENTGAEAQQNQSKNQNGQGGY